jgi:hypothetical protein
VTLIEIKEFKSFFQNLKMNKNLKSLELGIRIDDEKLLCIFDCIKENNVSQLKIRRMTICSKIKQISTIVPFWGIVLKIQSSYILKLKGSLFIRRKKRALSQIQFVEISI